jgi:hypothetical protein
VAKTVLVETLLECSELELLYDALPCGAERSAAEEKIRVCTNIIDYLLERYADANRDSSGSSAEATSAFHKIDLAIGARPIDAQPVDVEPIDVGPIDMRRGRGELSGMDDLSLLRYGTVLKYICAAEADLAEMSLEVSAEKLRQAREEWQRRFGTTVIAESI